MKHFITVFILNFSLTMSVRANGALSKSGFLSRSEKVGWDLNKRKVEGEKRESEREEVFETEWPCHTDEGKEPPLVL
jgi:hypothetical protein